VHIRRDRSSRRSLFPNQKQSLTLEQQSTATLAPTTPSLHASSLSLVEVEAGGGAADASPRASDEDDEFGGKRPTQSTHSLNSRPSKTEPGVGFASATRTDGVVRALYDRLVGALYGATGTSGCGVAHQEAAGNALNNALGRLSHLRDSPH